jgi:hypothetical protein
VLPGRRQPAHLGAPTLSALPYSKAFATWVQKMKGPLLPVPASRCRNKHKGSKDADVADHNQPCCHLVNAEQQRKQQQQQPCSQGSPPSEVGGPSVQMRSYFCYYVLLTKNIYSSLPLGTGFVLFLKAEKKNTILETCECRADGTTVPRHR